MRALNHAAMTAVVIAALLLCGRKADAQSATPSLDQMVSLFCPLPRNYVNNTVIPCYLGMASGGYYSGQYAVPAGNAFVITSIDFEGLPVSGPGELLALIDATQRSTFPTGPSGILPGPGTAGIVEVWLFTGGTGGFTFPTQFTYPIVGPIFGPGSQPAFVTDKPARIQVGYCYVRGYLTAVTKNPVSPPAPAGPRGL